MRALVNRMIDLILEIIFPPGFLIEKLEKMSALEFVNKAKKADIENSHGFPIFALFSYKDQLVRIAIRQVKYKRNQKIARLFAEILKNFIVPELEDEIVYTNFVDPIIVPIPSHQRKMREKGFNQTVLILNELSRISTFEIKEVLVKIKETGPQTSKNREERLKNLQNCFVVKEKELIYGRNIIVFDDVITTGGTLNEARRALKLAGARRIVGFALAH